MKELISVLQCNKSIMLYVLLSFVISEFLGDLRIFFIGSCILSLIASSNPQLNFSKQVDFRVVLIFLMFSIYWLFGVNSFPFSGFILFSVSCSFVYMLGKSVAKTKREDSYFIGLFIIIALCAGIYNIYVSISDMFNVGIVNIDVLTDKSIRDENWRPSSLITAELISLISCVVLFFVPVRNNTSKSLYRLGGYLSVIAIICTLHFISRTAVAVVIVCLIFAIIYRTSIGHKRSLWILLVLTIALVLFFRSGFWEMMEYKNQVTDLATGNGRIERMGNWIRQVAHNPFGVAGYKAQVQIYAHNFWIDFAKDAGWIPGICLLLFSVLNIRDLIRIFKNKWISRSVKLLTISMNVSFLMAFFVEPIYGGADYGMLSYFLFCGIVASLSKYEPTRIDKIGKVINL